MSNQIINDFQEETGLTVKEGTGEELLFSTREIYHKLFNMEENGLGQICNESQNDIQGVTDYRHWIDRNLVALKDETTGMPLFTNYKQVKIKNPIGRPMIDYLVDEETAKILILRSNTPLGLGLLKRLIRFEKTYSSFMKRRLMGRVSFISLTDSIKGDHDPAKAYHYSNEVNMIYKIMFGMDAKQLREERKVPENEDLRDYFLETELKILQRLEMKNAVYIDDGVEFQERKRKLIQWMGDIARTIEGD